MSQPALPCTARGIPRGLAPFLPEYQLDDLDPDRARDTLIERVLRYGNRAEVRWLFQRYGEPAIAAWVAQWGRLGLPPVHRIFWRTVLGLGEEEP